MAKIYRGGPFSYSPGRGESVRFPAMSMNASGRNEPIQYAIKMPHNNALQGTRGTAASCFAGLASARP